MSAIGDVSFGPSLAAAGVGRILYSYAPDLRWVGAGVAFWILGYLALRVSRTASAVRVLGLAAFSLVWILATSALAVVNWSSVRRARREGRVTVVQGPVADLRVETAERREEGFTVNGVHFAFGHYNPQVGYNGPLAREVGLREGSCVRVSYFNDATLGNRILLLELASSGNPADGCPSSAR